MYDNRNYIDLNLSLNTHQEQTTSKVQRDIIEEDLRRFDPIKKNDINISTSYVYDDGENLEASIFFRNGLDKKINFDVVSLSLMDINGEIIASQIFVLTEIGIIPPLSVRPYKIYFNKKNLKTREFDISKLKVVFSNNIKIRNTVKVEYEDMPENLSIEERRFFQYYLDNLSILEFGQVDLKCYDVRLKEDNIKVTILVRNGSNKKIRLEQFPITIYDEDKNIIYLSMLKFDDLIVSSMKAKLCNFMIDFSNIKMDKFNLKGLSLEFKN